MIILDVFWAEFLKLKRCKITWISWLAYSIFPIVGGVFMWIIKEPERAANLGLIGQKAKLLTMNADWASYFAMLNQSSCMGGMLLMAIIAAFVFGREFTDNTAKIMLTQPVGRHWFVLGKFIVILMWFFLLSISLLIEGFIIAYWQNLPGYSQALALASVKQIMLSGLMGFLLIPVIVWITLVGKGYLLPIGFTLFMLLMGNVMGTIGWGKWFPWSIVPMMAGLVGPKVDVVSTGSWVVILTTFAVGMSLSIYQMVYSDNTQ